jgi:hypothetical protein
MWGGGSTKFYERLLSDLKSFVVIDAQMVEITDSAVFHGTAESVISIEK